MNDFLRQEKTGPALRHQLIHHFYGHVTIPRLAAATIRGDRRSAGELCLLLMSGNRRVADAARKAISALPPEAREIVCDQVLLNENPALRALCREYGWEPRDPDRKIIFHTTLAMNYPIPDQPAEDLLTSLARGYLAASPAERQRIDRTLTASGRPDLLEGVLSWTGNPGSLTNRTLSLLAGKAAAHGDYSWLAANLFSFPPAAALTAATSLRGAGFYPCDGDPGYWKALYDCLPEAFEFPLPPSHVPVPFDGSGARYCSVGVSPAGAILAAGTGNGDLEIWQVPGGGIPRTIRIGRRPVLSINFHPEGTLLACGTEDGKVLVINSKDGEILREFSFGRGGVGALSWLSDYYLASGGGDGSLVVLSARNEDLIVARIRAPAGITSIVPTKSGSILTGYADGTIRGWDPHLEREMRFRCSHKKPVLSLACHRKDRFVVSGALKGHFLIHSLDTGELLGRAGNESDHTAMTIASDGTWCATGSGSGVLDIWTVPEGRKTASHFIHRSGINAIASSPDSESVIAGTSAGFLHVVPVRGSRPHVIVKGSTGGIYQLSAAGNIVAGLGWQGVAEARYLAGGGLVQRLEGRRGAISGLGISSRAGILALATVGGFIQFWDLGDVSHKGFMDTCVPSITALAVSGSGCSVVVASGDGSLTLLRRPDGSINRHFRGHRGTIHALAWSPDTTLCAAGGWDTRIHLYRIEESDSSFVLSGHRSPITALSFSPNGDVLASASQDRTIRLWDLALKEEIAVLEGHKGVVSAISFSPDAGMLASASRDRTIRLWSLPDATCMAILEGHNDWLTSLTFCDGGALASGDRRGRVAFWSLPDAELISIEESHAGSVVGMAALPDRRYLISVHQKGLCLFWHLPWTRLPREVSPSDLETIREHLRTSRENNGRHQHLWKFIEMLSIGHLRSSAALCPEPPLATGYEIELAGGGLP
jgi:WD40 repeat protein